MSLNLRKSLRITYSVEDGAPPVGYVYLRNDGMVHHTRLVDDALAIDLDVNDAVVGIEVLDFDQATLDELNRVLNEQGYAPLTREEFETSTKQSLTAGGGVADILEEIRSETWGLLSDEDRNEARLEALLRDQEALASVLQTLDKVGHVRGNVVVGPICNSNPTLHDDGSLAGFSVERIAVKVPNGLGVISYWVEEGGDENDAFRQASASGLEQSFRSFSALTRDERLKLAPHVTAMKTTLLNSIRNWRRRAG